MAVLVAAVLLPISLAAAVVIVVRVVVVVVMVVVVVVVVVAVAAVVVVGTLAGEMLSIVNVFGHLCFRVPLGKLGIDFRGGNAKFACICPERRVSTARGAWSLPRQAPSALGEIGIGDGECARPLMNCNHGSLNPREFAPSAECAYNNIYIYIYIQINK